MSRSASIAHAVATPSMWDELDRVTAELTAYLHGLSRSTNGRRPARPSNPRFRGIPVEDWRNHLLRWCESPSTRARLSTEWLDGLACAVNDFAESDLEAFLASFFFDAE